MIDKRGRLYTCDVCGYFGPWQQTWSTYGSFETDENGWEPLIACGSKCLVEMDGHKLDELLALKNRKGDIGAVRHYFLVARGTLNTPREDAKFQTSKQAMTFIQMPWAPEPITKKAN